MAKPELGAKWYVMGGLTTDEPWLLFLEPRTHHRCVSAIHWQRIGQGQFDPPEYWDIVEWDEDLGRFMNDDRKPMPLPNQAPYTDLAWEEFWARVGQPSCEAEPVTQ